MYWIGLNFCYQNGKKKNLEENVPLGSIKGDNVVSHA